MHLAHNSNLALLQKGYGTVFVFAGQSAYLPMQCILSIVRPQVLIDNLQWHEACLNTLGLDAEIRPTWVAAANGWKFLVVGVQPIHCPKGVPVQVMLCLECCCPRTDRKVVRTIGYSEEMDPFINFVNEGGAQHQM